MIRLREKYLKEVVPALVQEFHYKNPMQVPRVEKVVINIGLGEALQNPRALDAAVRKAIAEAEARALANKRKTLKPQDL